MENIKLDLPAIPGILNRAADFLEGCANELSRADGRPTVDDHEHGAKIPATVTGPTLEVSEAAAAELADAAKTEAPAPAATTEAPAPAPAATVELTPGGPSPIDVDLDEAGLPWDARIHASTKTKLARGGTWKYKRGTDKALIETVEAELRAAMAAAPPASSMFAPEEDEGGAPAPAPAETTAPAPAAAATGEVVDFPGLMKLITDNKIPQDKVLAAVNAAGLQSLQLVAARKDLIPTIAAELAK